MIICHKKVDDNSAKTYYGGIVSRSWIRLISQVMNLIKKLSKKAIIVTIETRSRLFPTLIETNADNAMNTERTVALIQKKTSFILL